VEMISLKLKLLPDEEQKKLLDEMFWKWASICTRVGFGRADKEDLKPPKDAEGVWFSLTQLNQANTDINDLREAMKHQKHRLEYEKNRLEAQRDDTQDALKNPDRREISTKRKDLFRPKASVEKGFLKLKYHQERYWVRRLKEINKLIERKTKTLIKIEKGRIKFKATRITLHQGSFKIRFGDKPAFLIKALSGKNQIDAPFVVVPEQPICGSVVNSKKYLDEITTNFLAYSVNAMLFGLSRSEEMLLKAKRPEKIKKKEEKLAKKQSAFENKKKELQKLLGRELTQQEEAIIEETRNQFFQDFEVKITKQYSELLSKIANELKQKNDFLKVNKYPILLRKPLKKAKSKKINNLSPSEWKYYLQFGVKPLLKQKSRRKSRNVLGIDRGLKHLLAVTVLEPDKKTFVWNKLYPNPITGWKWRRRKLLRSLKRLKRRIKSQKHETIHENQTRKKLKSLQGRIDDLLHNISRKIVETAKEYDAVIVVEDLQSMRQHGRSKGNRLKTLNYALSLFDYANVMQLIKYKAGIEGIQIYDVKPAGTSQNCAYCLLAQRDSHEYKRSQENSKIGVCLNPNCQNHKKQIDADLNAARVIASCYALKINDSQPFGTRKRFKKRTTN